MLNTIVSNIQGAIAILSPPKSCSKHKITLIKVVGNEKISLKIISAKAETTEIKLRTVSKHEMFLIKVIGNEKNKFKNHFSTS